MMLLNIICSNVCNRDDQVLRNESLEKLSNIFDDDKFVKFSIYKLKIYSVMKYIRGF